MVMRSQVGGWEAFSAASLTPSLSQSCILHCLIWLPSRHRGLVLIPGTVGGKKECYNTAAWKDIPPFLIKNKKIN